MAASQSVWPTTLIVAILSIGSSGPDRLVAPRAARGLSIPLVMPSVRPGPCPEFALLDGDVCVRWPDTTLGAPAADPLPNAHHNKQGLLVIYDQISRRPDRPANYDAYRYPVECVRHCVASGYDLDLRDDLQRRGRRIHEVGHGAVDLVQPKGTPVAIVSLDHQRGDAEVIFVGPLFGSTVITQHMILEGGTLHAYVALFGHLERTSPELKPGSMVKDGDIIGWVGDTGSPDLVHLHYEVRRVRDDVDVRHRNPQSIISNELSVVCDPRNVLPLR